MSDVEVESAMLTPQKEQTGLLLHLRSAASPSSIRNLSGRSLSRHVSILSSVLRGPRTISDVNAEGEIRMYEELDSDICVFW